MKGLLAATVFVEGKDDLDFVRQCMRHWGFDGLLVDKEKMKNAPGKICLRFIGGNEDKLFSKDALPILKEAIHLSEKTLFLLDADTDPCGKRKEIKRLAKKRDVKGFYMNSVFLIPDNESEGSLDTLRIEYSLDCNFHSCFGNYLWCLKSAERYKLPGKKERIYAYCKAVCGETPRECDYFDARHWKTDSRLLQPLEAFLKKHLPGNLPVAGLG